MFHPSLLYIIEEDNNIVNQDYEFIVNNFLDLIKTFGIACMFVIGTIGLIKLPFILGPLFWNSLTPGKEWLEIISMISTLATLVVLKIFLDDFSERLDKKMNKIQKQLEAKEKQLKAKEKNIYALASIIGEIF